MSNNFATSILKVNQQPKQAKVEEKKQPKYNLSFWGLTKEDSTPTTLNADLGCDWFVTANIPHFKTNSKNGEYSNPVFDNPADAYEFVRKMAELGVPGTWLIGQNTETGKYEVMKDYLTKKPSK